MGVGGGANQLTMQEVPHPEAPLRVVGSSIFTLSFLPKDRLKYPAVGVHQLLCNLHYQPLCYAPTGTNG